MPAYQDQTGRWITLEQTPQRIISLVPSQTELLFDLGLHDRIAGITKFCIHPKPYCIHKPKVGGTKQLKMDTIHQLAPDLIIANKEENVKEQVEELAARYPAWVSDVNDLASALEMITQVGELTGKSIEANNLATQIKKEFDACSFNSKPLTAAYLIWKDPYMAAGSSTFINSMMKLAGFINVFEDKERYPETSLAALQSLQPEVLLLSSEPFPFTEKHKEALQSYLPGCKIILADGELFSWYGSRLLKAPAYFKELWMKINSRSAKNP